MKYLICLSVIFWGLQVYSQDTSNYECRQYRTGKFTYIDSSTGFMIRVERTKRHQREYNDFTKVWIDFKIEWVTDCQYELRQLSSNSKLIRKFNHVVTTVVISKPLGQEGYEYTCACKGIPANERVKGLMSVTE
ncbi:MAG: replication/maintenance protein RepL [Ferruginibacter sp.]